MTSASVTPISPYRAVLVLTTCGIHSAEDMLTTICPAPATTAPGSSTRGRTRRLSSRYCRTNQAGTATSSRSTVDSTDAAALPEIADASSDSTISWTNSSEVPVSPCSVPGRPRLGSSQAAS